MPVQEIYSSRSTYALILLAIIAGFSVLKIGEAIFAPFFLALVVGVIMAPLMSAFDRIGLPTPSGALIIIVCGFLFFVFLAAFLGPKLQDAVRQIPMIWEELNDTIISFQQALRGLNDMSKGVAEALSPDGGPAPETEDAVAVPTAADALLLAPPILAQLMIFVGSLFFFLMSKSEIYLWVAPKIGSRDETSRLHGCFIQAEKLVSRYFLTITVINACFGLIIAVVMAAIGMPSPIVWGLLAFGMNYVLYIGPMALAVLLLLSGVVAFDGVMVTLPAALFIGLNMLEGQFITPALVGRHLAINPLLVFLSLVFWMWLWGPMGGFIAIPLLLWWLVVSGLMKPDQTNSSGTTGTM